MKKKERKKFDRKSSLEKWTNRRVFVFKKSFQHTRVRYQNNFKTV